MILLERRMDRNVSRFLGIGLLLLATAGLLSCGAATSAPINGADVLGAVSVSVTPTSMAVGTGTVQTFTATVNNSNVSGVQWEVNGTPGGGGDVGTIDKSGNYTAPQFIPKNPHVTITAVADADDTKSGSASVTITGAIAPALITIVPQKALVQIGTTLQLSATVIGPTNTAVTWTVTPATGCTGPLGSITAKGLYTAPAAVPPGACNPVVITATSVANPASSSTAELTITTQPEVNITISPADVTVTAGHSFAFTAVVSGNADTSVIWEVDGTVGGSEIVGTISSTGVYYAPTTVPPSKTVTVTAVSAVLSSAFASATVTIAPPLLNGVTISITPSSAKIQTGGETEFTAVVSNALDTSVTWQVNGIPNGNSTVGTIETSSGTVNQINYVAPNEVPAQNPVIVSAIPNADPTIQATVSVTITPPPPIVVTVLPTNPQVVISTTQQFTAEVQNAILDQTVTWSLAPNSGCDGLVGSTSTDGLYSAPATVPPGNCNPVEVVATSNQDHKTKGTSLAMVVSSAEIQVTLSPLNPSVQVNDSVGFTATVSNATDPSISEWDVNGLNGGNSTVGTVTIVNFDQATYQAPASVPSPATVTVTAISNQDPTKSGSTTVTITPAAPPITISVQPPGPVPVVPGQSAGFSATVNGSQDQIVNWSLSGPTGGCTPAICGTITAQTNGAPALYTAPQTVPQDPNIIITASTDAKPVASTTVTVIISANATLAISVSPANPPSIAAGTASPITFTALITNAPANTTVDWTLGCISLYNGGFEEGCGFTFPHDQGGPGCTAINGGTPVCTTATNPGPGNDPLLYTAPAELFTSTFEANSCEQQNNGSGDGLVPLTASVTFNGNQAEVTVCITVTP